jgi:exosortase
MTSIPRNATLPKPKTRSSSPLLDLLRSSLGSPESRPAFLGALLAVALIAIIFASNFRHFVFTWSTDENYGHGFLVPLLSLYFANQAAGRGPVAVRGGVMVGVLLLVFALIVKLATVVIVVGTLGDLALLASIAGVVSILAGGQALRRYGFAVAFLMFMIPLPVSLYAQIASPLQLLASKLASVVLNRTGVPVLTEGNMMTLPGGVQMFVAQACSGMRQLTGFLALTAAVAYLVARPAWYRAAIVLSALPIALTANVIRVTLTCYIMYYINPQYASGAYHTVEGLLMLAFGLSLLRAECWFLDQAVKTCGESDVPPEPPDDL